jgi:hypothetical protein
MKQQISIDKVIPNSDNPRVIKDYKFKKLVSSLKSFPEMLEKRPIIVDENMVVLGGNMRLKACTQAGLKDIWIDIAEGWTDEQKKEFVIKDNTSYGEWDWDLLANEYNTDQLTDWGMDVFNPSLDVDFTPDYNPNSDQRQLTKEEYEKRKQQLDNKNLETDRDFIQCICPNCFHEFNVDAKQ